MCNKVKERDKARERERERETLLIFRQNIA